jgi:hypothetical protein
VTYGTARQTTRAAKAAAVILTAVSCSVYDASLLGGGPAEGGHGGTNSSAGHSASGGEVAGRSGSAGTTTNGGASGGDSGDAGMMDTAGAMEAGGENSQGGTSGTGARGGTAGTTGGSSTGGSSSGGTSAGSGGNGTAGSGGTVGSGGTAGSSGGSAGAGGAATTGCAKLTVPIDASNDQAHFVISLSSGADMTAGTISMRVYVQAGAAGTIFNYVQNGSSNNYAFFGSTTHTPLKSLSGWQTLTFPVGTQAASGNIAKTDVRRIGIEINAAPDTTGWSASTVVYVDSITVTSPTLSFTFDAATTVSTTPSNVDVSGQVMWLNNASSDTIGTSPTLAWQQACP